MDARQALDDLMEVSAQVNAAAVLHEDGSLEAATIADGERAAAFAEAAQALLAAADETGDRRLTQLEVTTAAGCVFVAREGPRVVAATTGPQPTTGLVVYDLKTCLRNLGRADEKPKRRRAAKSDAAKESP